MQAKGNEDQMIASFIYYKQGAGYNLFIIWLLRRFASAHKNNVA